MTDRNLSPQAQAVLDAYWKSPWDPSLQHEDRYAIAAALRAAADQMSCYQSKKFLYSIGDAMKLLAIADELEAINEEDDFTIVAELETLPND